MKNPAPTVAQVNQTFWDTPSAKMWVPTKTRNEIIADQGYSAQPRCFCNGRVYRWKFVSIGGGMWEISLASLGVDKDLE